MSVEEFELLMKGLTSVTNMRLRSYRSASPADQAVIASIYDAYSTGQWGKVTEEPFVSDWQMAIDKYRGLFGLGSLVPA